MCSGRASTASCGADQAGPDAEQTRTIALRLIEDDGRSGAIDKLRDYDCSWAQPGVGRFRVNILRQRSSILDRDARDPRERADVRGLGLPRPCWANIAQAERGMVLVTGVTGSGKSSTMAALINRINATTSKHIVTLENPIEFLHRDLKSSVTQREIGVDTDRASAWGCARRCDRIPDVIMIGEMRDARRSIRR
jgi:twitching motility protein PilT